MDFIATTLLLFIVLDPLGNIPIYLSQLRVVPEQRRRFVALRELCIAYLLLLFFFFAGSAFMKLLSLDIAAVNIAGAVILFLIALRMALPIQEGVSDSVGTHAEPFNHGVRSSNVANALINAIFLDPTSKTLPLQTHLYSYAIQPKITHD